MMRILTRDDTEHGVEYVTKADADAEIRSWQDYATDACTTLRCERDALQEAIKSAIIELCPPARPSQVRRILRNAMGQPEWQIYNDDLSSPANAPILAPAPSASATTPQDNAK